MFLWEVYLKSKGLLGFMVLFIIGQVFFTYKGVETIPFFNYGMYSEPMPEKAKGYWIIANGDTLNNCFPHLAKHMIFQNIAHHSKRTSQKQGYPFFNPWKGKQNISPTDKAFNQWLLGYTEQVTGKKFSTIQIKAQ